MFDFKFFLLTFLKCLKAVPVTLLITFLSLLLSVLPAFFIAYGRIKEHKAGSFISKIYVSFMRGTPMVLQILIVYSLMPGLLNSFFKGIHSSVNVFDLNPLWYAFLVFTLNTAAVMSEAFRSALLSVSKGQYEAALCVGMSPFNAWTRILIPQAFYSALPNLCNLTVILIKNTSLSFMMTVKDITAVAKIEGSFGFNYIEAYSDIFFIYLIVCLLVQWIYTLLERKFDFMGIETDKKAFSVS